MSEDEIEELRAENARLLLVLCQVQGALVDFLGNQDIIAFHTKAFDLANRIQKLTTKAN